MKDVGKSGRDFDALCVYLSVLQKCKVCVCTRAPMMSVSLTLHWQKGGVAADVSLPPSVSAAAAPLPLKRLGFDKGRR